MEKKEQHVWALQCAIHAASLLNNQSNIFEEVSLATLASTTPELMTALQEVKTSSRNYILIVNVASAVIYLYHVR